jgi:predicted DNA-binding protein
MSRYRYVAEEVPMKKLMVYLDEHMHEDLRILAFQKKTTMAALVRYALDKTFEDELDTIAAERALEEAARDPSSTMSWEEYKAQRASGRVRAAS